MSIHMVSYDLSQPNRDYPKLIEKIKSIGASWAHPSESVWMIDTNLSVGAVRDGLKTVIDKDDTLFVVEMTGAWASLNLDAKVIEWLNARTGVRR